MNMMLKKLQLQSHCMYFVKVFALSWFFALASQLVLPVPFSPVPISVQPLPLFMAVYFFGSIALSAYCVYYVQGALGLPFFSNFGGGLAHVMGPKGGYLIGFFLAMLFLEKMGVFRKRSALLCAVGVICAHAIVHISGPLQLAFFVPLSKLPAIVLALMPGAFLKAIILLTIISTHQRITQSHFGDKQ